LTLDRKGLRKKRAAQHAFLKRSKSDPGLENQKDGSQTKFVIGIIKRSLSQNIPTTASMTPENLYEKQVESKIKEDVHQAVLMMETECRKLFQSYGIPTSQNLEEDIMDGVVLFELLGAIQEKPLTVRFHFFFIFLLFSLVASFHLFSFVLFFFFFLTDLVL